VLALVESLYSQEDTFLIDVDDGNNPDLKPIRKLVQRDNVHLICDSNIGWGGSGTLRKTISGAFSLLEIDTNWEYYIVLSGQDLPLKSNRDIKKFLSQGAKNETNYIRCTKTEPVGVADIPVKNKTDKKIIWGDRGHTKIYGLPGTIDPQSSMYARSMVDVTEVGEESKVYVGLADDLLYKRRLDFFSRYPFHVGANWFNLHRSLIEHMYSDSFTYELYDVIRSTFIPDESFFQTYIKNSTFAEKVDKNYGRLILRPGPVPRVKVLDMGDWGVIENSTELFGRKFDTGRDKKIVRQVLDARAA